MSRLNRCKKYSNCFVLISVLVLPVIIVAITLGVALDYYGDNKM